MTLTILPNAKTQFLNGNAVPLEGGSVFMYVPNTTTFKDTWQDPTGSVVNTNPIILDSNGECKLWGSGEYRQVVQDNLGNLIWDALTVDPGFAIMASFNGTSATPVNIGTGSKSFTTQLGLQFFPGGALTIASQANPLNYMNGIITAYDTTTGALTVNILSFGGSGTHSDWNISVSGVQGPPGTVTAISIASANGFTGSSTGGGTPQLTIATSVTGLVKGNGTALSVAAPGTDYVAPGVSTVGEIVLAAGSTSVAPLQFQTGTNLTSPVTGSVEFDGTNLFFTVGSTRYKIVVTNDTNLVTEAMLSIANNTTGNVSTGAHGFAPILPNDITKFLNGVGGYSAPVVSSLVGTSITPNTIGLGSTTFTTQAGLTLGAGVFVIIPSNADATNYFYGQITSYSGTTLIVNVTVDGGSGTYSDWNIFISGPPGAAGSVVTSGSPASGNLTKFSGSSSITNGNLTGDVTTTNTLATTITANAVTNAKAAQMAANTIKMNATNALANVADFAVTNSTLVGRGSTGNIALITTTGLATITGTTLDVTAPGRLINVRTITSSTTYTATAGTNSQVVELWGGGGANLGGTAGGNTTFDVMTAGGGFPDDGTAYSPPGTSSGGDLNAVSQSAGTTNASGLGGYGGSAAMGGGGGGYQHPGGFPGGGAGSGASDGGGSGGAYCMKYYAVAVTGISLTIGAGGTGTYAGAAGCARIWEFS